MLKNSHMLKYVANLSSFLNLRVSDLPFSSSLLSFLSPVTQSGPDK